MKPFRLQSLVFDKHVMSRMLELPSGLQKKSREQLYVQSFYNSIGHFIKDDGRALRELYNTTSVSKNGSNSQRYFAESVLQDVNSTGHNIHGTSHIPLPDWPVALSRWGVLWDVHIYGFSVLYIMLIIISVTLFLRFRFRVHRFRIVFNTLILLAASGVFRAVFMLVDPYGYKGKMTGLFVGIMTQAVYPLFCASYGLTQVTLVRITNADVGHSKVRTLTCILGCTLTYLFLVVVIETLVFYQRSLKMLLLIDTGCFIVWSLCLGITFICSGFRLTQHMTENSKELHASDNQQLPENITTNVNLTSSVTNETNITIFSVDLNSSTLEPATLASTHTDTIDAVISEAAVSPAPQAPSMRIRDQYDPCRILPCQRLEMLKRSPVIIALAEDDDDKSTSSTDIERPRKENINIRKRTKRRIKHRKGLIKIRSEAKSSALPSKYKAVSATEEASNTKDPSPGSRNRFRLNHNDQNKQFIAASGKCTSSLLNKTPVDKFNTIEREFDSSSSHARIRKPPQEASDTTYVTSSELPLLSSNYLHPEKSGNCHRNCENGITGDDCEDNRSTCKHVCPQTVCECNTSMACQSEETSFQSHSSEADINTVPNKDFNMINCRPHLNNADFQDRITSMRFNPCQSLTDTDQTKENGYLADAENVISTHSSASRPGLLKKLTLSRARHDHNSRDLSLQRSSGSYSDEDSVTSASDRRRSSTSISLESFPDKQTKLVQAAVYLTYVLTLLFMFACLLQLYTAFGVYGVLGTIPRPDPWPWLIFQSIFRFTEISIGLVIASIALIALQHRHKRYKRRHQNRHRQEQQPQEEQHLETTGDCTV